MKPLPVGEPDVSVVVPLRDEAEAVDALVAEVGRALSGRSFEIVLVDDGSIDGTWARVATAAAADAGGDDRRVFGLRLRRGFGKGAALAAGFARAGGRVVVTLDGDLQDDPADIPRLLAAMDSGLDVAVGWRRHRADPLVRTMASLAWNLAVRLATGVRVHDANCGIKAVRREVLSEVRLWGEHYRLLAAVAHQRGFRVGEVEVNHRPRRHGRSKYGPWRAGRGLMDLVTVVFLDRYGARPGHLFGWTGCLLGTAGLAICCALTWRFVSTGAIWPHHPLLAFGVLLLVMGVQFVLGGLLAELVLASRPVGQEGPPVAESVGIMRSSTP